MVSRTSRSRLLFDLARHKATRRPNVPTLFGVKQAPCDRGMRERPDEGEPSVVETSDTRLLTPLQRGQGLNAFEIQDHRSVVSIEGTGVVSSKKGHCDHGCTTYHRNGAVTFHHQ